MEEQKPKPTRTSDSDKEATQALQRMKLWIDLAKWFITSVAIVVATMIIDWGFKDRQAGLAELKFYNNYVTELIVLNPSPVQKRMLAQYFACVTPSEKLRQQWVVYYDSLYREYIEFITPVLAEETRLQQRYQELLGKQDRTDSNQDETLLIEARLEEIRGILFPEMTLPDPDKME